MTTATKHLELAIEVDSDPISGSVSNGAQRSEQFSGWIELVAAIEAVRSPAETLGARDETLGFFPGANASEL